MENPVSEAVGVEREEPPGDGPAKEKPAKTRKGRNILYISFRHAQAVDSDDV